MSDAKQIAEALYHYDCAAEQDRMQGIHKSGKQQIAELEAIIAPHLIDAEKLVDEISGLDTYYDNIREEMLISRKSVLAALRECKEGKE